MIVVGLIFLLGFCCFCFVVFRSWFFLFFISLMLVELFFSRGWVVGFDRFIVVWILVSVYFFLYLGGVLFLVFVCFISVFNSLLWEERRLRVFGGVVGLFRFATFVGSLLVINIGKVFIFELVGKKIKLVVRCLL